MLSNTLRLLLVILSTITITNSAFANQEIQMRSGNGTLGSQDSAVRVLSYARLGDVTPSATDFITVKTAPYAYVITDAAYISSLPSDPAAQWIAALPNKTAVSALYAIPFEVTDTIVNNAILDFHFAVDNAVNGVYINGSRISGNSYDGDYHAEYRFLRDDVAQLLRPHSTNWLYINVSDFGAISALIFSARITITSAEGAGISPNVGGNSGKVTVRISLPDITPGSIARLSAEGQPDIIGEHPQILSEGPTETPKTLITTFDLRGATPGLRDVIVEFPDGTFETLPSKFGVVEGGRAVLTVELVGPSLVRAGRDATFLIVLRNLGRVDAELISVEVLGLNQQTSAAFDATPLMPIIAPFFPLVPAQSAITKPLSLNIPASCLSLTIKARSFRDNCDIIDSQRNAIGSYLTVLYGLRLANLLLMFSSYTLPHDNPLCANPHNPFAQSFCDGLKRTNVQLSMTIESVKLSDDFLKKRAAVLGCPSPDFDLNDISVLDSLGDAVENEIEELERLRLLRQLPPDAPEIQDVYKKLDIFLTQALGLPSTITFQTIPIDDEPPPDSENTVQICGVTSLDPNYKTGPEGSGIEHYIGVSNPIPYAISFENKATASADAQEVTITDQLDSALDWSTVSFGYIKIGNRIAQLPSGGTNVTTVIDLRPNRQLLVRVNANVNLQTGFVSWQFISLDPATGGPPTDPLIGFLPPNVNPPEGEGVVFFTVSPKKNLPTNTVIGNKASIVFDVNSPIVTPEWLNTIDNSAPSSHVLPLADQSSSTFIVQWLGTDLGSGLRDFTVYVSDNGGPYVPWLTQTTGTQAVFSGVPNHTYAFFSLTRDFANNIEGNKTQAESSTVITNHSPFAIGKNITVVAGDTCTAVVSAQEVDNGSHDPDGDHIVLTLEPAGPFALGPHTVLLTATDPYGATDSTYVTVTVIDKTPPTIKNVSANPSVIWPPDKKLVDVEIRYETSDNCGQVISRLRVNSNEPSEPFDVEILDAHHLRLRGDRRGSGSGRIYTVTIFAVDDYGNSSSKDVSIYVPHDQRR